MMPGQAPGAEPVHHPPIHHTAAAPQAATDAHPAVATGAVKGPALPPSLMDKPAEPAKITLGDGVLAIHADNSSLSAILDHLAASSGMTVDGFVRDQRIFGTYGPGKPEDILSGLLQDAGYNFVMAGTTDKGTPKEIVLTTRSGGGATATPSKPDSEDQPDENDDDSNNQAPEPQMPEQMAPPPSPETAPPNPGEQVRTPAEIIQELQRMRQQQQNPQ
jgi:hypothetical protein